MLNGEIVNHLFENNISFTNVDDIANSVVTIINLELADQEYVKFMDKIRNFSKNLTNRWQDAQRIQERFFKRNNKWLNNDFILSITKSNQSCLESSQSDSGPSMKKAFVDLCARLCDRQNRRRTKSVRNEPEAAAYVAKNTLKSQDAKFVFDFLKLHPKHASKIRKF